jgi:hypothetical protein
MRTQIADVIVPSVFTPYTQQLTMEKTAIIQSGIAARDDFLDNLLAGGGLTFTVPSWQDIGDPAENVSSDNPELLDPEHLTQASAEVAVRLSRNASWSTMRLATALAGADPMQSIAGRVSDYWVRRLQRAFVAVCQGIFANNALADPTLGRSGQTGINAAYGKSGRPHPRHLRRFVLRGRHQLLGERLHRHVHSARRRGRGRDGCLHALDRLLDCAEEQPDRLHPGR